MLTIEVPQTEGTPLDDEPLQQEIARVQEFLERRRYRPPTTKARVQGAGIALMRVMEAATRSLMHAARRRPPRRAADAEHAQST